MGGGVETMGRQLVSPGSSAERTPGDQGRSSSTEPWLSSATVLLGVYPAHPHGQKFT